MEIRERIAVIMKVNQHNASSLADLIGVQRSSVSHILNGRNKPSLDFMQKLLSNFPKVDANWLLTGKEPTKKVESQSVRVSELSDIKTKSKKDIDRIVIFYSDNTFDVYEQ